MLKKAARIGQLFLGGKARFFGKSVLNQNNLTRLQDRVFFSRFVNIVDSRVPAVNDFSKPGVYLEYIY